MSTLKIIIVSFIVGVITGIAGLSIQKSSSKHRIEDVKTTQLSGEKIEHSNFDYSPVDRITFITHAAGEGVISTEIPKTNIPEARAWMMKNHALQVDLIFGKTHCFGLSYYRRWGTLSAGGGPIISREGFEGIKISGQMWF